MEKKKMYMLLYVFLAIVIVLGGTIQLFKTERQLTSIMYFVGSLVIVSFFGVRWFDKLDDDTGDMKWPPVINTCPDYLTYYKRTVNGQKVDTCIDVLGVSRKPDVLAKWTSQHSAANPPADDKYYFSLVFDKVQGKSKTEQMCERALEAGVTWEGITDGLSCTISAAQRQADAAEKKICS
jgi:hypothetical protein